MSIILLYHPVAKRVPSGNKQTELTRRLGLLNGRDRGCVKMAFHMRKVLPQNPEERICFLSGEKHTKVTLPSCAVIGPYMGEKVSELTS